MTTSGKRLLLLKPRGFCAGVVRAIDIVRIALETLPDGVFLRPGLSVEATVDVRTTPSSASSERAVSERQERPWDRWRFC